MNEHAQQEVSASHGISMSMSIITLCKNIVGAGVFSLPASLKAGSIIPGLLCLVVTGAMAAVSFYMLGYSSYVWGLGSCSDLWRKAMIDHQFLAAALDWTIFVNGSLTLITYCILIADFLPKALQGLLGEGIALPINRFRFSVLVSIFVLLPLCFAPDLRGLRYSSTFGLAALGYAVALVFMDSVSTSAAGRNDGGLEAVTLWEWNPGLFHSVALCSHAYVAHYNAPKLYMEMNGRSMPRWVLVVAFSYALVIALYVCFSLAGVQRFGPSIEGNLLRMYPPVNSVLLAWAALGMATAMSYPLVFNTFRESCITLLCKALRLDVKQLDCSQQQKLSRYTTLTIVPASGVIGGLVNDLGTVNALAGAVTGCALGYIFPAIIFRAATKDFLRTLQPSTKAASEQRKIRLTRWVHCSTLIGLFGVVSALICTCIVALDAIKEAPLGAMSSESFHISRIVESTGFDISKVSIEVMGDKGTMDFRAFLKYNGNPISPWHDLPYIAGNQSHGQSFHFVCEVPRGTVAKMEVNKYVKYNPIMQDSTDGHPRYYLYRPEVGSLVNYGMLPQTWDHPGKKDPDIGMTGDSDPIDVLQLNEEACRVGSVQVVRIIGIFALIDAGTVDWKVLAVKADDTRTAHVQDISDFPEQRKLEIIDWFRRYKVAEGKGLNEIGFGERVLNRSHAIRVCDAAHQSWEELVSNSST